MACCSLGVDTWFLLPFSTIGGSKGARAPCTKVSAPPVGIGSLLLFRSRLIICLAQLRFNLILLLQFFLLIEISPYLIHFPSTQNFNFCISNINHKRCGCGHIEGNISNISYSCIENIPDLGRILAPSLSLSKSLCEEYTLFRCEATLETAYVCPFVGSS